MRIAVTAQSPKPNGLVDPRFGRARYLMVYDTQAESWEALENTRNLEATGGAGVGTAELLARHQVELVLTGRCGPKAADALAAAAIQVQDSEAGTVADAVRRRLSELRASGCGSGRIRPSDRPLRRRENPDA